MFIDTHCHLNYKFDSDINSIIQHANESNVKYLICASAAPKDIPEVMNIIKSHDNIFATIGIHPDYIATEPQSILTENILTNKKVVGIGEIGLDYHYHPETKQKQIELFEKQLEIAQKYNLPIAIHTRDAEEDTKNILVKHENYGVMHCFTSNWDLAKPMLDRNFYFSASGILTFKNAEEIRETFAKIPLDRIVIETDSPYCAPIPYRGKICEPCMIIETAKILAQIKKLQLEDLESILEQNTLRLYSKCHVK